MYDRNLVYDKRDFTIWEIEASVVNPFEGERRYVVRDRGRRRPA